jgi:hypothetical protein
MHKIISYPQGNYADNNKKDILNILDGKVETYLTLDSTESEDEGKRQHTPLGVKVSYFSFTIVHALSV